MEIGTVSLRATNGVLCEAALKRAAFFVSAAGPHSQTSPVIASEAERSIRGIHAQLTGGTSKDAA